MSEQEQSERVAMVVMAHPDDAEFGCGGAVAAWVREGWTVHYVVCTDASAGGGDGATECGPEARATITATRKAEQRAAADILGVSDVVFLDYPDGLLQPTIELRKQLVALLRRYRPTRVVCQSPERSWQPQLMIGRYHPDHLAAGTATLAAIYPASQNPWDFPELLAEGLLPHRVREILVMGTPSDNYAVDITATFATKMDALRAHASQVGMSAELEDRMRSRAATLGAANGMELAELFHRTTN
ncbi:PIG-L family deacetylase [Chloroflexia bacterium SDU3-3]|nr:PIG-L family deacetylase [Chloroflexia bacterium SDU3-3]